MLHSSLRLPIATFLKQIEVRLLPDEAAIRRKYRRQYDREIDLENPRRFSEKLQWLKLHWRHPLLTRCADKHAVRPFVAERIGPAALKECYGVYEHPADIDPAALPDAFVLKTNHGCGQNLFCTDKERFDWGRARTALGRCLKHNNYYAAREWAYRDIPPRILCEEHLTPDGGFLEEYAFYCFNGTPRFFEFLHTRGPLRRIGMFDLEFRPTGRRYLSPPLLAPPEPTPLYEQALANARALCREFPFVRVDQFAARGRLTFGELTFYPLGGFPEFRCPGMDEALGGLLELPSPLPEPCPEPS